MARSGGVWLLDLVMGQTWRFASREIDGPDGNRYVGGLDVPDPADELDLFSTGLDERTVPLSFSIAQVPGFVPSDLVYGGTGTLYWWADPDGSEDPTVFLVGAVVDPEFGSADEPVSLSLREAPWNDQGRIPALMARVDDDTFASADSNIVGEVYPTIIGAPGGADPVYGSPGLVVHAGNDEILIAGHRVEASTVAVYVKDVGSGTANVTATTDALGRPVSVIDTTATPGINVSDGDEVWISWAGTDGGLPSPDGTGALRGAGDVIEYLLARSTIRWDRGRIRAIRPRLNGYKIDGYIQPSPGQRVTPWEWLQDHVLPLLPVSVRVGDKGLFLAAFDPGSPIGTARATIEEGRNASRISQVSVVGTDDVVNDLSMAFAPRADTDATTEIVRLTGDRSTLDTDSGAIEHQGCIESVRRYGRRPLELRSKVVYDRPTAVRALRARAAAFALPPYQVAYETTDPDLDVLEPGDAVSLTDAGLGGRWTSAAVAYVWSTRPVGPAREIVLRRWLVPGRDFGSVA